MSLLTPSGGLVYHARALVHRRGLWAPFRAALGRWLSRELPPGDELVLVGPSAGHCLPLQELARFPSVLVLEPDPLARRILRKRLSGVRFQVEQRDVLLEPLLSGGVGLDAVLEARPRASVLFCNVLGQLHFGLSERQQTRFEQQFRQRWLPLLAGRRWASFHDRWSLDWGVERSPTPSELDFEHAPTNDELGLAWFGPSGPPLTVLDHRTSQLFPEAWPRRYFGWPITARALHVVEGVSGA